MVKKRKDPTFSGEKEKIPEKATSTPLENSKKHKTPYSSISPVGAPLASVVIPNPFGGAGRRRIPGAKAPRQAPEASEAEEAEEVDRFSSSDDDHDDEQERRDAGEEKEDDETEDDNYSSNEPDPLREAPVLPPDIGLPPRDLLPPHLGPPGDDVGEKELLETTLPDYEAQESEVATPASPGHESLVDEALPLVVPAQEAEEAPQEPGEPPQEAEETPQEAEEPPQEAEEEPEERSPVPVRVPTEAEERMRRKIEQLEEWQRAADLRNEQLVLEYARPSTPEEESSEESSDEPCTFDPRTVDSWSIEDFIERNKEEIAAGNHPTFDGRSPSPTPPEKIRLSPWKHVEKSGEQIKREKQLIGLSCVARPLGFHLQYGKLRISDLKKEEQFRDPEILKKLLKGRSRALKRSRRHPQRKRTRKRSPPPSESPLRSPTPPRRSSESSTSTQNSDDELDGLWTPSARLDVSSLPRRRNLRGRPSRRSQDEDESGPRVRRRRIIGPLEDLSDDDS